MTFLYFKLASFTCLCKEKTDGEFVNRAGKCNCLGV